MSRVAVIGAGGIGGLVAARLALHGQAAVDVCVRTGFESLTLEVDGRRAVADVSVLTATTEAQPAEWVVLTTKAHQTVGTAPWLERLCTDHTTLVVLQNGVEHTERVKNLVPPDVEVVPGIVKYGAEAVAPGHVRMTLEGEIVLPDTPGGHAVADLLGHAGLRTNVDSEFATALWTKLAYNLAGNAVTAITELRVNLLPRSPDLVELIRAVVRECIDVGRAEGALLHDGLSEEILDHFRGLSDATLSSMHQDRRRGGDLEFDALTGAVVRVGERHEIGTPYNRTLLLLLAGISAFDRHRVPPDAWAVTTSDG